MHSLRPMFRDQDCLRKDTSGLAVSPCRIHKIDIEGEDHTRLERAYLRVEGCCVCLQRVKPIAGIFEGAKTVSMHACLADTQSLRFDRTVDPIHSICNFYTRLEELHTLIVGGQTPIINGLVLLSRLPYAEGPLHMRIVPSILRVYLTRDDIATGKLALGRQAKGMGKRMSVGGPQK